VAEITASSLFLGLLFGSIGLGLFMYGRKQRAVVPLLCGLVLLVVPYLISSAWLLLVIGGAVVAIAYFVRV
jgi:hypothetical protein